ncbi:GGDEF domain-containing protein [Paenibacillus filicis]|uniref:GGDEF domain-containing protein n=1 Tax=Paenibacillus filicis TaxID=669464 RepID=A0ABU9DF54_9BACL
MATERGNTGTPQHRQALREELLDILRMKNIHTVYQPIVSLSDGVVRGYEALTRGPSGSGLEGPLSLFGLAAAEQLLYPLDRLARESAISHAVLTHPKQLLFLNLSAEILNDPSFVPGQTLELLKRKGLSPANVVLEITERSSIDDFDAARRVLEHYRKQGYRIAIDDAGAGYSSLQAIAELQPDFLKADRSLISNIHQSKTKESIIETLLTFAEKLGISLVAEGIEKPEELLKLAGMGVHYGQGYLLGRPQAQAAQVERELVSRMLEHGKRRDAISYVINIGDLSTPCQCFDVKTPISVVADHFNKIETALGAVITTGNVPVGLIMRERLFQQLAGQYGYSLFWNRPIEQLMDDSPLIADQHSTVETVSRLATSRDIRNLYDLVIVTAQGQMHGTVSIRAMLECITNAKMENARVANALTGLPGNLQINRELNRRLAEGRNFSVVYADLDYFKWFNDRFGFHRGDQLIQYTAECLGRSVRLLGTESDFVGHIGGDDFIVLTSSSEPEKLCAELLRHFDSGVSAFYETEDWTYVEDRDGNRVESEGLTLSLSLVICETGRNVTTEQISQAAAQLKKKSKAHRGSIYYCDFIGMPES